MNEVICPVCNHTFADREACIYCGYQHSCDYEQYPTLCTVSAHTPSRAGLRAQWEQEQARIKAAEEFERVKRELAKEREKRAEIEAELKAELKALQDRVLNLESQVKELQITGSQGMSAKLQENKTSTKTTVTLQPIDVSDSTLPLTEQQAAFRAGKEAFTKGDYAEAVKWYRKAAEQGYADAQCDLGYCYHCGLGVSTNYDEAVKWFLKAAGQGDSTAQYNLGCCYSVGKGVSKELTKAVMWYRMAAMQGNASAQYRLGYCYDYGYGVEIDHVEAVKWYREAAGQGNTSAQYELGCCYKSGIGVRQNAAEAVKWYRKAAEQGDTKAQRALERLNQG